MHDDTIRYNQALAPEDQRIGHVLAAEIDQALPEAENKLWHAHPVWFLDGNPIVGYSKLKAGIRLLFWSGQSFPSGGLRPEGKFKAADIRFRSLEEVQPDPLRQWLAESREIQWDYKRLMARKGRLDRLK